MARVAQAVELLIECRQQCSCLGPRRGRRRAGRRRGRHTCPRLGGSRSSQAAARACRALLLLLLLLLLLPRPLLLILKLLLLLLLLFLLLLLPLLRRGHTGWRANLDGLLSGLPRHQRRQPRHVVTDDLRGGESRCRIST